MNNSVVTENLQAALAIMREGAAALVNGGDAAMPAGSIAVFEIDRDFAAVIVRRCRGKVSYHAISRGPAELSVGDLFSSSSALEDCLGAAVGMVEQLAKLSPLADGPVRITVVPGKPPRMSIGIAESETSTEPLADAGAPEVGTRSPGQQVAGTQAAPGSA